MFRRLFLNVVAFSRLSRADELEFSKVFSSFPDSLRFPVFSRVFLVFSSFLFVVEFPCVFSSWSARVFASFFEFSQFPRVLFGFNESSCLFPNEVYLEGSH